jgi:hypothetical protein
VRKVEKETKTGRRKGERGSEAGKGREKVRQRGEKGGGVVRQGVRERK